MSIPSSSRITLKELHLFLIFRVILCVCLCLSLGLHAHARRVCCARETPIRSNRKPKCHLRRPLISGSLAGCSSTRPFDNTSSVQVPKPDNATGPQPPLPIQDADPSRRHPVFVRVPISAYIRWRDVKAGLETVDVTLKEFQIIPLTIGYKMLTGYKAELLLNDDSQGGGSLVANWGYPVPPEIRSPAFGSWNPKSGFAPRICRITIFETDQLPGYHVDPEQGVHYRVLWARTFKVPPR
jgi:hypothetical protein